MFNVNTCQISGRLVRDAETNATGTVCKFTVAVNNNYKGKDGQWIDEAAFVDVKAFSDLAGRCAGFNKGDAVYVDGKIKQENWEKDGKKQSKLVLSAVKAQLDRQSAQAGESPANGQEMRSAPPAAPSLGPDDDGVPF